MCWWVISPFCDFLQFYMSLAVNLSINFSFLHLSNYNRFSDRARYWSKIVIFSYPLHSTPPLGGFPSEHRHPVWYGKTRMVWLPDGENISKIFLFVLAQLTNVTDARTDRHRVTAYTALMHMHRAVKHCQSLINRSLTTPRPYPASELLFSIASVCFSASPREVVIVKLDNDARLVPIVVYYKYPYCLSWVARICERIYI